MSGIDAIQNALQALNSLPAQLEEQNNTIGSLRAQVQQNEDTISQVQTALDTLHLEHAQCQKEHKKLQLALDLALKQKDAALSRREALEKAREADMLELEALREEVRQLKAQELPVTASDALTRLPLPNDFQHEHEADEDAYMAPDFKRSENEQQTNIPEKWLTGLSVSPVETPPDVDQTHFKRAFLSQQLGGGTQGVIMRVAKSNTNVVLKQYNIERYYCPNKFGNPYLPSAAGQHGFLFIGMSIADQTVGHGECCEVFVGVGTNDWRYFGSYKFTRVTPLSPEDYSVLPIEDQRQYCKFTVKKKLADSDTEADLKYQAGELRVPCVRMECIAFNHSLFDDLRANMQRDGSVLVKRGRPSMEIGQDSTASPVRSSKRFKTDADVECINLFNDGI